MDILTETLGEAGVKKFLAYSLPHIKQRNIKLLENLTTRNWELAAQHAHIIKGTANLYATDELLILLDKISRQISDDIANEQTFARLCFLLQQCEEKISNYLSER